MSVIGTAVTKIGREFPDSQILGLTYFQLAAEFIDEIRDSDIGGMAHGGEFETSLMLYLRPDLVDLDEAEAQYMDDPYDLRRQDLFLGGPLSIYRSFAEYSDSGAIGDPGLASSEKGAEIYDRIGDEMEALLVAMWEHNR
jgi:creatinine amidohydrolase